MSVNLENEIEKGMVVLLVVPSESYSEQIIDISRQLAKHWKCTCYVNLNKIYSTLIDGLTENKIDHKGFFFIDGITKTVIPSVTSTDSCEYVSSVSALTELSISIGKVLEAKKCGGMLFDSLSTLLIYNRGDVVTGFVHDLIGKSRVANCPTFYTCLDGDTESKWIKDLGMFVDKVIRLQPKKVEGEC